MKTAVILNVRISPGLSRRVTAAAKAAKLSKTAYVEQVLEQAAAKQ